MEYFFNSLCFLNTWYFLFQNWENAKRSCRCHSVKEKWHKLWSVLKEFHTNKKTYSESKTEKFWKEPVSTIVNSLLCRFLKGKDRVLSNLVLLHFEQRCDVIFFIKLMYLYLVPTTYYVDIYGLTALANHKGHVSYPMCRFCVKTSSCQLSFH